MELNFALKPSRTSLSGRASALLWQGGVGIGATNGYAVQLASGFTGSAMG